MSCRRRLPEKSRYRRAILPTDYRAPGFETPPTINVSPMEPVSRLSIDPVVDSVRRPDYGMMRSFCTRCNKRPLTCCRKSTSMLTRAQILELQGQQGVLRMVTTSESLFLLSLARQKYSRHQPRMVDRIPPGGAPPRLVSRLKMIPAPPFSTLIV